MSRLGRCNEHCNCVDGVWRCCRVRKDVTQLSQDEWDLFVSAMYTMRQSKTLVKRFQYLVDKHVQYKMVVHSWPYFLPWHRMWLYLFEEILQSIDCRVTIPYYDFTKHWKDWYAHTPFDEQHLGSNGYGKNCCVMNGPFRKGIWKTLPNFGGGCLQRTFNKSKIMPSPKLATIALSLFEAKDEKLMSNMISKYFHDYLHLAVGGQMMLSTAAVDPTFWLLHAFLDKMWGAWQERGPEFKKVESLTKMKELYMIGSPSGTKYTAADFYDLMNQPKGVRVCYSAQMTDEEAEFRGVFTAAAIPRSTNMENFSPAHLMEVIRSMDKDELEQLGLMFGLVTGREVHTFTAMPNDCLWMNQNGSPVARPGLPKIYSVASDNKM